MTSEPTLYRELQPTIIEGIVDSFGVEAGDVAVCVKQILDSQVPVERCKHGKIDAHWMNSLQWVEANTPSSLCPGAGIGDTE